mmetsp:Transcript_31997/g.55161  ORF Transcript_31997/g.55161 Transcript_31997/m.55161 type:complete len:437 (+) Transcript_31997:1302-2612(+)
MKGEFRIKICAVSVPTFSSSTKVYTTVTSGVFNTQSEVFSLDEKLTRVAQHYILTLDDSSVRICLMKKASFLGSDHLIGEIILNLNTLSASSKVEEKTLTLISHSSSQPVAELTVEMQLILPGVSLVADSLASQIAGVLENIGGDQVTGVTPGRLTSNFKRFLVAVTPLVKAKGVIADIYTWKSTPMSVLACFSIMIFRAYQDWVPILALLFMYVCMIYTRTNAYNENPNPDLGENLLFIQESMGHASSIVEAINRFVKEVVYWEKKELSQQLLDYIRLCLIPCLILCIFFPFFDLVLWGLVASILLSNSIIRYGVIVCFVKVYSHATNQTQAVVDSVSPTDLRVYRVFENQRLWLRKWSNMMLPHERNNWSDVNGEPLNKDTIVLPQGFAWQDMWHIEGDWEYAVDFSKKFHSQQGFFDYVRRRCWVRTAETSVE